MYAFTHTHAHTHMRICILKMFMLQVCVLFSPLLGMVLIIVTVSPSVHGSESCLKSCLENGLSIAVLLESLACRRECTPNVRIQPSTQNIRSVLRCFVLQIRSECSSSAEMTLRNEHFPAVLDVAIPCRFVHRLNDHANIASRCVAVWYGKCNFFDCMARQAFALFARQRNEREPRHVTKKNDKGHR